MPDSDQSQEPLTEQDKAVLSAWSTIGAPGAPPTTTFVPTDIQRQNFKPIQQPKTISVNWVFGAESYKNLQLGHESQAMEDKWDIYMEGGVVHFHRSWTGMELFRFTVQPGQDGGCSVSQFDVEQDPESYTETNEQVIVDTLRQVLQVVLRVT